MTVTELLLLTQLIRDEYSKTEGSEKNAINFIASTSLQFVRRIDIRIANNAKHIENAI